MNPEKEATKSCDDQTYEGDVALLIITPETQIVIHL